MLLAYKFKSQNPGGMNDWFKLAHGIENCANGVDVVVPAMALRGPVFGSINKDPLSWGDAVVSESKNKTIPPDVPFSPSGPWGPEAPWAPLGPIAPATNGKSSHGVEPSPIFTYLYVVSITYFMF
jgi:hypothetical protein